MKKSCAVIALISASLMASLPVLAQQKTDFGKHEYNSNCAVCHGLSGKGDGPYAGVLDTRIPDLIGLSKRNGGVFPLLYVAATIDGTAMPKRHGTSDMPIWGTEYRIRAGEAYFDVPYDPETYVRVRILALTDYVSRLQQK